MASDNASTNTGTYGGGKLELDPRTGVLTWDGSEIIIMRVKLINRLFGRVLEIPAFSTLLRNAGISAGRDFAIAWLLQQAPQATSHDKHMPADLIDKGQAYLGVQERIERGLASPADVELEQSLATDIHAHICSWVKSFPVERIRGIWEQMNALDAFGGWGKTTLTNLNIDPAPVDMAHPLAELTVIDSFMARQIAYWNQQGFGGTRVCSFLEGYFLGEAQILLGRDELTCKEIGCRLEGKPVCSFVVQLDLRG